MFAVNYVSTNTNSQLHNYNHFTTVNKSVKLKFMIIVCELILIVSFQNSQGVCVWMHIQRELPMYKGVFHKAQKPFVSTENLCK